MSNESEARDLRVALGRLARSREALEGLAVVGDAWAEGRLGQIDAAIREKTARLASLALYQNANG
jgi:hypothetical protein